MRITEENIGYEEFMVRSADTDRFYDATIPFFFSLSQEVAGEHASEMGLGIKEMSERDGKTWVIVRTKMDFYRIPKWREKITFETFAQKGFKLFCPRVVKAADSNGNLIMNTMTHWVLMDLIRKRPALPKIVEDKIGLKNESLFLNPDIGKIKKFEEANKIEILEDKYFKPCYYDIDTNKHVNNVVYVRWLCESLTDDIELNYRIKSIDVQWESQTFEDDEVKVETAIEERSEDALSLIHRITKKSDGKIAFEAASLWTRK